MWAFLKRLHEDEGGFLEWLIPLLITGIQYMRQNAAQQTIDQAEQAKIPGEEGQIKETLALRGLGNTSAYGSQVGEPSRQFAVNKRVRGAQEVLGTETGAPLSSALQLYQYLASKQGDVSNPSPGYSVPTAPNRIMARRPRGQLDYFA